MSSSPHKTRSYGTGINKGSFLQPACRRRGKCLEANAFYCGMRPEELESFAVSVEFDTGQIGGEAMLQNRKSKYLAGREKLELRVIARLQAMTYPVLFQHVIHRYGAAVQAQAEKAEQPLCRGPLGKSGIEVARASIGDDRTAVRSLPAGSLDSVGLVEQFLEPTASVGDLDR